MDDSILPSSGPYTRPSNSRQHTFPSVETDTAKQAYLSENQIILKEQLEKALKEIAELKRRPEKSQEVELQRQLTVAQKTIRKLRNDIKKLTTPPKKGFVSSPVRADNTVHRGWW